MHIVEFEFIISTLTYIVSLIISISSLAYWLGRKFAEIDHRFIGIDEKFKK